MAMEAIKGAGMTYQGSVSSAESQPKTDSAVKAAETDATPVSYTHLTLPTTSRV